MLTVEEKGARVRYARIHISSLQSGLLWKDVDSDFTWRHALGQRVALLAY